MRKYNVLESILRKPVLVINYVSAMILNEPLLEIPCFIYNHNSRPV
jgi:hypothetical protein